MSASRISASFIASPKKPAVGPKNSLAPASTRTERDCERICSALKLVWIAVFPAPASNSAASGSDNSAKTSAGKSSAPSFSTVISTSPTLVRLILLISKFSSAQFDNVPVFPVSDREMSSWR